MTKFLPQPARRKQPVARFFQRLALMIAWWFGIGCVAAFSFEVAAHPQAGMERIPVAVMIALLFFFLSFAGGE